MYGTVAHIRVKVGHEDGLRQTMRDWNTERKPKVAGAMSAYLYQMDSDPQDWIMVALFQNRETYRVNADDPDQAKWFQRLMGHLEAEPQWHDGEVFEV